MNCRVNMNKGGCRVRGVWNSAFDRSLVYAVHAHYGERNNGTGYSVATHVKAVRHVVSSITTIFRTIRCIFSQSYRCKLWI